MVAYLTKSDASEGFNQIINFLNGCYIKYAITVNPDIYVSCIKQFWNTVAIKQVNDVTRLQALVDRKKVVITEAAIREVLRLVDAKEVDCLPNEEIFAELARMGYEKSSTKLTFYKAFFSRQWKFLIHTILQSLSAKRTSWNEFSSAMASAVICLSAGRKFNFSKYIFDNLVRNVDSTSEFYMYPHFIQLLIRTQLEVETPLFEGMLVEQMIEEGGDEEEHVQDVADSDAAQGDDNVVPRDDAPEPTIPSPTPPTPPPQPPQDLPSTSQALEIKKLKRRVKKLEKGNRVKVLKLKKSTKVGTSQRIDTSEDTVMDDASNQGRIIDEMDKNDVVALMDDKEEDKKEEEAKVVKDDQVQGRQAESQAEIYKIDLDHASKVLSMQEDEPVEVQEVVDVVTTAKDPEEESTTSSIKPTDTKSKDKGKGIMVEEPKPLKKKQQVEMDEEYARKVHVELNKDIDWDVAIDHVKQKAKEDPAMQRYQVMKKKPQIEAQARKNMIMYLKNVAGFRLDYFKGMSYDDIRLIFEAKFNSNIEFLLKIKEQMEEEESRALQSINEIPAQKAAKRRKLNEEVKDLKRHL
nr:hypothetical protein [Tanacetum cinerariifolium]